MCDGGFFFFFLKIQIKDAKCHSRGNERLSAVEVNRSVAHAAAWCNARTVGPSAYCVACLFNPSSVSAGKVGNLQAMSALHAKHRSEVPCSHIASPPFLLLSHFGPFEEPLGEQ